MFKKFFIVLMIIMFVSACTPSSVEEDDVLDNPLFESYISVLDILHTAHYSEPSIDELIQGSIEGMIDSIGDPHTSYFDYEEMTSYQASFEESYSGIGVSVRYSDELLIVEQVFEGSPAETAGIRVNDVIAYVDYEDIRTLPYGDIIALIVGEAGTTVTIGVIRDGQEDPIHLDVTRATISNPTIEYEIFLKDGKTIGYIDVNVFGDDTDTLFIEAITNLEAQGIDGLMIDVRNNGGGRLTTVVNMLKALLVDNDIPMFSTVSYTQDIPVTTNYFGNLAEPKSYPIVTLVNGGSASASEVFASSMKEHGGYEVVGLQTYGKGTMQTDYSIVNTDGDSLHISIGKWLTSDGNWVHFDGGTDGVIPTIQVSLSDISLSYKMYLYEDGIIEYDTVGDRVQNLQVILSSMGYDLRVDGYVDSVTLTILNSYLDDYLRENDEIFNSGIQAVLND
jgi:carboxyl-terminal processing protease